MIPKHTPEEVRKIAVAIVAGLKENYPSLTVDFMAGKVQALLDGAPARSLGVMGMWARSSLVEAGWLKGDA